MDVELEVLEGETSPSDKDDSWSESAERLGYFIPETKSSGTPIPKPNYSKTAGENEGVFNPKEKNLLERDGTKFNKFWSNTDAIYSESETINTTPYNIPNEQDIPEQYSEVSKTDSGQY